MLLFDGVFGLFMIGLWIFCVIDVITTPEDRCRNLPKIAWVLIVILLIEVGAIVWLVAGRPWQPKQDGQQPIGAPKRRVPTNPDDDEEFLAGLRARADEQRRRARDAQQHGEDGTAGDPTN